MDRGGLTVKQAAAQLGVAEKTIYRRLRRPGHGGLDAWKVHTTHGEEWRVNLTAPLDTSQDNGQDTEADLVSSVPVEMSRPSVSPLASQVVSVDLGQVLALVSELVQERDRLARENERLRAAVQSRRRWWQVWRRGGQ